MNQETKEALAELLTALNELEEKRLIRRVRTPAGVERYDKPIGAIITRGSINYEQVRDEGDYAEFRLTGTPLDTLPGQDEDFPTRVSFRVSNTQNENDVHKISVVSKPEGEQYGSDAAWMSWDATTGRVDGLNVHPGFQRRGVASVLWQVAEAIAEENDLPLPQHSETQTNEGRAWARSFDERRQSKSARLEMDRFERKARRIRRVRTPGGARHFGQPIGSIIVRDVPSIVNEVRSVVRHSGGEEYRKKIIESLDDLKWSPVKGDSEGREEAHFEGLRIERVSKYVDWVPGRVKVGDDYYSVFAGKARVPMDHVTHRGVESVIDAINKHSGFRPAKRTKRQDVSLWDEWQGTYGWDWQNESDEWTEEDFLDPLKRQIIAHQDSVDLGITVQTVLHKGSRPYTLDPNVHEIINSTARIIESWYPGFKKVQNDYGIGSHPTTRHANAWNGQRVKFDGTPRIGTLIQFNYLMFEADPSGRNLDWFYEQKRGSHEAGWSSIDHPMEVAEEVGVEPWQVAVTSTLVHEMGHTVARMVFGEIPWPGIDRPEWRDYFLDNAQPILLKYGIIRNDAGLDDLDTRDHKVTTKLPVKWNKAALMAHVSEYGSTNMHEMMAEVWASYLLDPKPNEFVQEFGAMMEELMLIWMDEAGVSEDD